MTENNTNVTADTQNPATAGNAVKAKNTLGLVALILSIVGFIFACIPGALIIGWVLLPVSFILGIVAICLKGKKKAMGIAAICVAVVGTIVGFVVFAGAVGSAVNKALDEAGTAVSESSTQGTAQEEQQAVTDDATTSSREKPLALGTPIKEKDWTLTVNSVTLNANDAVTAASIINEPPADGKVYIMANVTVTYTGDKAEGENPMPLVEYVAKDGKSYNGLDKILLAPDALDLTQTLYKDATATGNIALQVPADGVEQGVLAVKAHVLGKKQFVALQ